MLATGGLMSISSSAAPDMQTTPGLGPQFMVGPPAKVPGRKRGRPPIRKLEFQHHYPEALSALKVPKKRGRKPGFKQGTGEAYVLHLTVPLQLRGSGLMSISSSAAPDMQTTPGLGPQFMVGPPAKVPGRKRGRPPIRKLEFQHHYPEALSALKVPKKRGRKPGFKLKPRMLMSPLADSSPPSSTPEPEMSSIPQDAALRFESTGSHRKSSGTEVSAGGREKGAGSDLKPRMLMSPLADSSPPSSTPEPEMSSIPQDAALVPRSATPHAHTAEDLCARRLPVRPVTRSANAVDPSDSAFGVMATGFQPKHSYGYRGSSGCSNPMAVCRQSFQSQELPGRKQKR
ncbi:hypothetical protein CRUP_033189 [Coryphaenoides rupestris]|nr:hypothetical protein CRUP_033189 [Coryphaenoides rupestris]